MTNKAIAFVAGLAVAIWDNNALSGMVAAAVFIVALDLIKRNPEHD